MSDPDALRECHLALFAKMAALQQHDLWLLDQARERIARSISLLERTERGVSWSGEAAISRLSPPLTVTIGESHVELVTVSDLIAFVRGQEHRWRPLRDETFVAAVLPSPARLSALRALALASFRAAGFEAR